METSYSRLDPGPIRATLLGTGTALVIHIANTSAPRVRVLRPDEDGLAPVRTDETPEIVVLEVSGNLHYAAVAPFEEEVERLMPASARAIIIDLSHAHEIRFAALRALERLCDEAAHDGAVLWLAGVDVDTARLLERSRSKLSWVPEDVVPGLSVERCIEKLGSAATPGGSAGRSRISRRGRRRSG